MMATNYCKSSAAAAVGRRLVAPRRQAPRRALAHICTFLYTCTNCCSTLYTYMLYNWSYCAAHLVEIGLVQFIPVSYILQSFPFKSNNGTNSLIAICTQFFVNLYFCIFVFCTLYFVFSICHSKAIRGQMVSSQILFCILIFCTCCIC